MSDNITVEISQTSTVQNSIIVQSAQAPAAVVIEVPGPQGVPGPVTTGVISVNGKTGVVVLDANDVGAYSYAQTIALIQALG